MYIASVELQKSIYNILITDYPVFEVVPPNTPLPYIVLGEETLITDDTKTSKRTSHNITIHTWTSGKSSLKSKELNHYVIEKMVNGFSVVGFTVDNITLNLLNTLKENETDTTIFHGVIQFEIILTREE